MIDESETEKKMYQVAELSFKTLVGEHSYINRAPLSEKSVQMFTLFGSGGDFSGMEYANSREFMRQKLSL